MYMTVDLAGIWECQLPGYSGRARLPGTLDENGIGFPDALRRPWHPDEAVNGELESDGPIATRLTRRHTFEGPAVFRKTVTTSLPPGKRVFLEAGRSRHLTCRVNGREVPHFGPHTLSSPHAFELTGLLTGRDTIELISDNSYPGWPVDGIVNSSAATDETQTNWNGILGYVRLALRESTFISCLRVYPSGDVLNVYWDISGGGAGDVIIETPAASTVTAPAAAGHCALPLHAGVRRWDEGRGELYPLTASLGGDSVSVTFGVRDFSVTDGRFALNGRGLFIRGEANCAVFPETGHEPMDTDAWRHILRTYMSYGVNLLRFHSHCPPEAAFEAADELGLMLQPELSHWDPKNAFGTAESREYYRAELFAILACLANHPSFVMLTLGNELWTEGGFPSELLREAKKYDPTRLYAVGSNNRYGQLPLDPESDFYTSASYLGLPLRGVNANMTGWINDPQAGLTVNYQSAVELVHAQRPVPVISFEVGQYEVLPDFGELEEYTGVTDPANLRLVRDRAASRGLLPRWREYVSATGELALICYRMEVEAALRTPGLAGISLLGLQDFPGQGTALVGMLNAHLRPKPYGFSDPGRFRAFFTDILPLAELKRFTYSCGETLSANIELANYGRDCLSGVPTWSLSGAGTALSGPLQAVRAHPGRLTDLGRLSIRLPELAAPAKLTLRIELCGHGNIYDIWVYPNEEYVPRGVHICRCLDGAATDVLRRGGRVLLEPHRPGGVKGQFSTDFWSVGTFPTQEGGMGFFLEKDHPVFDRFPTGSHTDLQWRRMAGAVAVPLPEGAEPIVTLMDSYAYMRRLACVFEGRMLGGRLMVSTLGLPELSEYPEARALRNGILRYMASEKFSPSGEISPEAVHMLRRFT